MLPVRPYAVCRVAALGRARASAPVSPPPSTCRPRCIYQRCSRPAIPLFAVNIPGLLHRPRARDDAGGAVRVISRCSSCAGWRRCMLRRTRRRVARRGAAAASRWCCWSKCSSSCPACSGTLVAAVPKADARGACGSHRCGLRRCTPGGRHGDPLLEPRPAARPAGVRGRDRRSWCRCISLPARWLGRRALETRGRASARAGFTHVRVVSTVDGIMRPAGARLFGFAVASLLRSRRHLLVLATYLGVAIAICDRQHPDLKVRHASRMLDTPREWVLALPLVFLFFLVIGLRASFRIPTEIEANWPFRLSQPTVATASTPRCS